MEGGLPARGLGRAAVSVVTYLPGAAPRPPSGPADPRVVGMLEGLLARARRGEVLSAAVAMVVPHESGVTAALSWSDVPEHAMALVGACSKLARDITEA